MRSDVPRLMLGAMDLFVFPSLYEGLGLALVEAQAAGLPCICSDVIPGEADVVPGLVTRISLTESPAKWAHTIIRIWNSGRVTTKEGAYRFVDESMFNLSNSIGMLEAIYCGQ